MKIKLERTYRSPKGNPVFVYSVTGSESDLAAYEEAQGEYYRTDDDGQPLWFTTRCVGEVGTLIITSNGNIVPDMSKFDQAASLAAQYGGNFGEALAKMTAASILGTSVSEQPQAPAKSTKVSQETEDSEDSLDDL